MANKLILELTFAGYLEPYAWQAATAVVQDAARVLLPTAVGALRLAQGPGGAAQSLRCDISLLLICTLNYIQDISYLVDRSGDALGPFLQWLVGSHRQIFVGGLFMQSF